MSSLPGGCGSSGMAGCPPLPEPPFNSVDPPSSTYMVNSKIMVVAVAVLFAVVVFILSLHVYAKWFWRNQGALGSTDGALRTLSWRRRRRAGLPNLSNNTNPLVVAQSVGLEKSVIEALPTFEFDAKTGALECAVCLEEFEEGEMGRTLPKCGHHFHVECVDMWLHSHSTCPLCRSSVHNDEPKGTEPTPEHQHPDDAPVSGDVQAPFMAAMRASRRRQRASLLPSTGVASLTSDAPPGNPPTDSEPRQTNQDSTTPPIPVDPKALALQYEAPSEIPSNVLFWGNQTPGAQPSASQPVRAPFQVAIDISGGSSASGIAMSPMARASASFRRLLSRGKSVVSPQGDGPDEGGSSSSPHHPHQMPPPPPSNNAP